MTDSMTLSTDTDGTTERQTTRGKTCCFVTHIPNRNVDSSQPQKWAKRSPKNLISPQMVENTVHSGSNLFRANSHNQQRWLLKMYRIQRLLRHSVGDVLFERERRSKRKMGPSLLPDSAHQRSTRQYVRILCNDFSKCSKELLHLIHEVLVNVRILLRHLLRLSASQGFSGI